MQWKGELAALIRILCPQGPNSGLCDILTGRKRRTVLVAARGVFISLLVIRDDRRPCVLIDEFCTILLQPVWPNRYFVLENLEPKAIPQPFCLLPHRFLWPKTAFCHIDPRTVWLCLTTAHSTSILVIWTHLTIADSRYIVSLKLAAVHYAHP